MFSPVAAAANHQPRNSFHACLAPPQHPPFLSLCLTMAGDCDGTSSKSVMNNAQPSTSSQEPEQPPAVTPIPPTPLNYPEWAAAYQQFQAYCASSSLGGNASVPPPVPHPSYIWANQFMPPSPYGALPLPQSSVYPAPYGGFYFHHSIPPPSHLPGNPYGAWNSNPEAAAVVNTLATNAKIGDGKEPKKPSPSLGKVNGGRNTKERLPSEPANDHHSSGESGSEGLSKDNEDAPSPNSFCLAQDNRGEHRLNLNGGTEAFNPPVIATEGNAMVMAASSSVPTTSLNIGMDYWNGTSSAQIPCMYLGGGKQKGTYVNHTNPSEIWAEREVKRQKRKESNRESARRSRLRKQAEFDDLTKRLAEQKAENENLRRLLDSMREERKRLTEKNEYFQAKLRRDNAGKGILQEHTVVENDSVQEGKRREMVGMGNNEEVGVHVEIHMNNNDPARSSNLGEDRENNNRAEPQLQLLSQRRPLISLQPAFNPSVLAK